MTRRKTADDRTLQDDRAELEADPHEGSPLTEGEGAPLAEDDVPPEDEPVTTHAMLGGASVPIEVEDSKLTPSAGSISTAEDRPIGD